MAVTGLLGLSLVAGVAQASTLTPEFDRLHDRSASVVRQGDFDGDGRTDELYFSSRVGYDRIDVRVRLNTVAGPRDVAVTSLDARDASDLSVQVVAAGHYAADCGNFASDCTDATVSVSHDSLLLAVGADTSVLAHWQNDHFEQDFVRSDEALMAHIASALYALNP